MMRRGGPRRLGTRTTAGAKSLVDRVRRSLAGGAMFEAPSFNTSGGNVTAFVDRLDAAHLLTVTGTLPNPTANAGYANALTAAFTGTQYATSNRAASAWTYASAGSGFDIVVVLTPKDSGGTNRYNAVLNTCNVSAVTTEAGIALAFYGTAQEDSGFAVNAISAFRAIDQNGGAVVANTPTYLRWSYVEGASPEWQHWYKTTSINSGNSVVAPSPSTPSSTLRMGAKPDGSQIWLCDWYATYIKPGRFSAGELAALQTYIQLATGIV